MDSLQDQVAIVTGGALGIGGAIARQLAASGARVLIADINVEAAGENAARIRSAGHVAEVQETDVAAGAAIRAMVERAVELWGRLDILVNNAYNIVGHGWGCGGVGGERLEQGDECVDRGGFSGRQARDSADEKTRPGQHREHLLGPRFTHGTQNADLRGRQGGHHCHDAPDGHRFRAPGNTG